MGVFIYQRQTSLSLLRLIQKKNERSCNNIVTKNVMIQVLIETV